jgi:lysophospholipid acyltransferase (LPLAT)-like uncharacterized protein
MKAHKALIRSQCGCRLVGLLLASLIAGLMLTIRWSREDQSRIASFLAEQEGVIMVFWHERTLAMPWLWPRRFPLYALQSPHADGRMMAHVIGCFGVRTIWGSSNRQPRAGLRGLMRVLQDGKSVALTPDGPRGPARRVAVGPVALAQMTGKPIVPLCWATTRHWRASGWDRMFVPKPFSSGRFVMGAPLHVGRGGTRADDRQALETARQQLAAALNDLGDQAMALATGQMWPSVSPAKDHIIPGQTTQK